eukprot:TRINITY_DN69440_c0_g1_i1.p1 TRINITY_DN69440_c0_g1~~TRINITY_DN69440_c0_g1_i1.p1  ORF type:complete len:529 (-),score=66.83 TRINITY_DN69440_c0_g1_i1:38-1624(-)
MASTSLVQAVDAGGGHHDIEGNNSRNEEASSIFPFDPWQYVCCGQVHEWIPKQWRVVQSFPHLVLLSGSITSSIVITHNLYCWKHHGCMTLFCQVRILTSVFGFFCTAYFVSTVFQYDDRWDAKQKAVEEAQAELRQKCDDVVSEIDGLLARSVENNAGLAERSFESKRRDFQRFLARVGPRLDEVGSARRMDGEALMSHFLGFVTRWLNIFSEASVDPVGKPRRLVSNEEMRPCATAGELAALVEGRCRNSKEILLVSSQRNEDREEMSKLQKALPKFQLFTKVAGNAETDTTSWLQFHGWAGICTVPSDDEDVFPLELCFGFLTLRILSHEHLRLIVSFFIGCYLLSLHVMLCTYRRTPRQWKTSMFHFADLSLCMVCLCVVLYEFRNMNVVDRLQRSIEEWALAERALEHKRDDMTRFYSSVQEQADVWLYRTIPRLDVMGNFLGDLEDAVDDNFVGLLKAMNEVHDTVDSAMPPLQVWKMMNDTQKQNCGEITMRLQGAADAHKAREMAASVAKALVAECPILP